MEAHALTGRRLRLRSGAMFPEREGTIRTVETIPAHVTPSGVYVRDPSEVAWVTWEPIEGEPLPEEGVDVSSLLPPGGQAIGVYLLPEEPARAEPLPVMKHIKVEWQDSRPLGWLRLVSGIDLESKGAYAFEAAARDSRARAGFLLQGVHQFNIGDVILEVWTALGRQRRARLILVDDTPSPELLGWELGTVEWPAEADKLQARALATMRDPLAEVARLRRAADAEAGMPNPLTLAIAEAEVAEAERDLEVVRAKLARLREKRRAAEQGDPPRRMV